MQTALALAGSDLPPDDRLGLARRERQRADDVYHSLVVRLSLASVKKHFDAYADVAWDEPEFRIDPDDPRWECAPEHPLGQTSWYRALAQPERARLGLALVSFQMKTGITFESVLQRGLLELASTLPNGSPEFRYAYHEVIEEGQHSLMFQEFVNRSGFDSPGINPFMRYMSRRVPVLGRRFPELFFVHVLAGETPIDHVQRQDLRRGDALHPLQRRLSQIHVTEEARHVCFAEQYLATHVPRLSGLRLLRLRAMTPFVLRETCALMFRPPARFFRMTGIPEHVAREAYGGPAHRALTLDGLAPIRELCVKTGIVTPALVPLWRALGVWPAETGREALRC